MRLALTLLTLSLSTLSSAAFADISNGGFENGLTGWDKIGHVFVIDSTVSTGEGAALIAADAGIANNSASLQTFIGVFGDDLRPQSTASDIFAGGAAIQQSFTAKKGDLITFDWRFLTNELVPPQRYDFSFYALNGKAGILTDSYSNSSFGIGAAGFEVGTSWSSFNLTANQDGINTLSFGVLHTRNNRGASALVVDNIQLAAAPVPEPETYAMMLAGLGLLGVMARRKAAKTKRSA